MKKNEALKLHNNDEVKVKIKGEKPFYAKVLGSGYESNGELCFDLIDLNNNYLKKINYKNLF